MSLLNKTSNILPSKYGKECSYWVEIDENANQNSLRKHAYSNILKISSPKHENFQIKNSDIFHISAQNIDCGYLLEPPR